MLPLSGCSDFACPNMFCDAIGGMILVRQGIVATVNGRRQQIVREAAGGVSM